MINDLLSGVPDLLTRTYLHHGRGAVSLVPNRFALDAILSRVVIARHVIRVALKNPVRVLWSPILMKVGYASGY